MVNIYGLNLHWRGILVSFFHDSLSATNNEYIFLQDFLVILKRMLQNYLKILKQCFLIFFNHMLVRYLLLSWFFWRKKLEILDTGKIVVQVQCHFRLNWESEGIISTSRISHLIKRYKIRHVTEAGETDVLNLLLIFF